MIEAFTPAPVLQHCNYEWEVVIETDASVYLLAGVQWQDSDEGVLSVPKRPSWRSGFLVPSGPAQPGLEAAKK